MERLVETPQWLIRSPIIVLVWPKAGFKKARKHVSLTKVVRDQSF